MQMLGFPISIVRKSWYGTYSLVSRGILYDNRTIFRKATFFFQIESLKRIGPFKKAIKTLQLRQEEVLDCRIQNVSWRALDMFAQA